MNKLLEGKVAVVTGATRGIGKAIAMELAQQGAHLAICGTNATLGAQVEQELHLLGGKVKFYQVDLAIADQVNKFTQQVLTDFEVVDILVNNAGITRDQLLMKLSEEDWNKVITTNLTSVFHMSKAFIRPMIKARKGKIINITSVVGLTGNAGQSNYAAAKAGMIGFSRSLAQEVGSRGITVNCVAPGFIKSDMTDVLSDLQKETILKKVPLGRLGAPEEIAKAVLFLSSSLSDYITGQVITVDGGMVMG